MRVLLSLIVSLALPLAACGDDESSCTEPDGGDGKLHPTPNGQHTTEDAACTALTQALGKKKMTFVPMCVSTSALCPQFLRADYGEGKEYDQGSVDGCIEFYNSRTSCDELRKAPDDCVLTIYPTPKPAKSCP